MKRLSSALWLLLFLIPPQTSSLPYNITPYDEYIAQERRQLRLGSKNRGNLFTIARIAVAGGYVFDDPDSYQRRALSFVQDVLGFSTVNQVFLTYYALACIFFASSGVHNEYTLEDFPLIPQLPPWTNTLGWATPSNKCFWHGVECDINDNVVGLFLPNNRMFGVFAAEVQLLAPTLERINVDNNIYLATFGEAGNQWIAKMTNLRQLRIGTTAFSYNGVPVFFNRMPQLELLDFSNSRYSNGPIRGGAFVGLTGLRELRMSQNTYTTPIPPQITALPNLREFFFEDVVLSNNVEQNLRFLIGMPRLIRAWMDLTSISDGLPTELGTISTLQSFSLTFCDLTGTIPTELGNLSLLQELWFYQNNLVGNIPVQLGNLGNLRILYLEGNNLQGAVPIEVCERSLLELGADCDALGSVACSCCTCCGQFRCGDFND